MGPLEEFQSLNTDEARWVWMAGLLTNIQTTQQTQAGQISDILQDQFNEVAGCAFHPSRNQNGDNVLKRLDRLERLVLIAVAFAMGSGVLAAVPFIGQIFAGLL